MSDSIFNSIPSNYAGNHILVPCTVCWELLAAYQLTLLFSITGNARNCGSPDAVEKVRHQIIEKMDLWLSECHASGRSSM
jgi:hypothetical protein